MRLCLWLGNSNYIEDKTSGTQLIEDLRAEGVTGIKAYEPPPRTTRRWVWISRA
jgi:hypothetical protein